MDGGTVLLRTKEALIPFLLPALLAACGDAARGRAAFEEGRYADARAAFERAEAAAGDDAPAALAYDRALAALAAGDLADAEAAAGRAAARGGAELRGPVEFLRGCVAFARCEVASRQANTVEAEPFAFDIAIALAEKARAAWEKAAIGREDWPEARRNLERAMLRKAELTDLRGQAEQYRRRQADPRPRPVPAPPPPPEPPPPAAGGPEAASIRANEVALSPEEVRHLLERLAEKEKEKQALRRTAREAASAGVERDW